MRRRGLIVACLVAAGCEAPVGAVADPRPDIVFHPEDLTTNPQPPDFLLGADVTFNLADSQDDVADAVRSISEHMDVVTWPEGQIVGRPFIVGATEAHQGIVQMILEIPWEERWYAVRMGEMPGGLALHATGHLPDGSLGTRFFHGSAPYLKSVRFEDGPFAGQEMMTLTFTESGRGLRPAGLRWAIPVLNARSGPCSRSSWGRSTSCRCRS